MEGVTQISEPTDTTYKFNYYKYRGIKFRYSLKTKTYSIEPYYTYYRTAEVVKKLIDNHLDKQKL